METKIKSLNKQFAARKIWLASKKSLATPDLMSEVAPVKFGNQCENVPTLCICFFHKTSLT